MCDEGGKDFFDRGKIGVKIEVLFLDVQNEGVFGMKIFQSTVAFVSFGHKIFSSGVPVRITPENRNLGADIMRRMQSAFAQNVRAHGGGSCFSMHAGDDNAALSTHDRSQRFGATHN